MIQIIVGTNRPNSNSLKVAQIYHKMFSTRGEDSNILELSELPLNELDGSQYAENKPAKLLETLDILNSSKGLLMVVPEYNGSYPGALKYFIDHWSYPETFEYRPVAFAGLGGRFGGLRPVEHLQQVFGYRNAYVFPERIFLSNVWGILKDGKINDNTIAELMERQVTHFVRFIRALEHQELDANSLRAHHKSKS